MNEFQFLDIIFLAAVAAFIAFKLRGTLGHGSADMDITRPKTRSVNKDDRVIPLPGVQADREPEKKAAEDIILLAEIEDTKVSQALVEIKKQDPEFSVGEFLTGAKTAFEWVFDAFVKGNKSALKSLLKEEVYVNFIQEIERQKEEEAAPESTLVAITDAEIAGAEMDGSTARLTVKFVSEQVTVIRDKEGKIVDGDPSQMDIIENEWVFERNLKSGNPNWLIIAT